MIHVNKTFPAAALPTLLSPSLVVFIVILTYVVCLIDICVVKSLRRICLGVKERSQHMTFRCNVESTSLTTIVFDFGLAVSVRRDYSAFFFQ